MLTASVLLQLEGLMHKRIIFIDGACCYRACTALLYAVLPAALGPASCKPAAHRRLSVCLLECGVMHACVKHMQVRWGP